MTINQKKRESSSVEGVDLLFGSKTRAKLLKVLLLNESISFSLSDLSKQIGMDVSGVFRELSNLLEIGIVLINTNEKNPSYKINSNHLFYLGLVEIFKETEKFSKKYFLFEDMPIACPAIAVDYLNVNLISEYLERKKLSSRISKSLSIYEYPQLKIYFYSEEFKQLSKEILSRLVDDPNFGIKDVNEVIDRVNLFLTFSDELEKTNFASFSDKQLLLLLKKCHSNYESVHLLGWVGNTSDMPDMLFTKHLLFVLRERIRKKGSLINPQSAFSKLTTPREDSFMQMEHEALLQILIEIDKNPNLRKIFSDLEPRHILDKIEGKFVHKEISLHAKKYGWLGYGFVGPGWDETYFVGILSSLLRQKVVPEKLIEEIKKNKVDLTIEQEKIIKSLELDAKEMGLFEAARGFVFTKGLRKDAMFKFFSKMELLYREISRRTHLSITDIRFCFPHEFEKLFSSDSDFYKLLQERQKFSLCESIGAYAEDTYLVGKDAKKYIENISFEKEDSAQISVLTGTCACPGRVRGKVKIINTAKEMIKMEKGDVLVSIATSPDLVVAMKKASAIVTDMGGITSHAAIVSRELNIPCVVGTKLATKALKDNTLVDVDATHGVVKIVE
jgi:phosphoenolpyruvate synthase/pyruvate phosphate dikinase